MKRKIKIHYVVVFLLALLAGCYAAMLISGFLSGDLTQLRADPLHVSVSVYTVPCCILMSLAAGAYCMTDSLKPHKYRTGREYGSAQWGDAKALTRQLSGEEGNAKIISSNLRIPYDTRKTHMNNNACIIAGSGAGKTTLVSANLYTTTHSVVVTDPKGEILLRLGEYLRNQGYIIKTLNIVDMDTSDRYNPLQYVSSEEDVHKLAHNFMQNTSVENASGGDPFWIQAPEMLLTAVMMYVWMEYRPQDRNLIAVADLLATEEIDDEGNSRLKQLFGKLPEGHPALTLFRQAYVGAADTIRSLLAIVNSRMKTMLSPKVRRLLSADDMALADIGVGHNGDQKTRTALFLVIPDVDKTYNYIPAILYTQLFQILYFQADHMFEGKGLPVSVDIWMDEFYNVSLPENFDSLESTMRSRNISVNVIIQNVTQLEARFTKTWEVILGNASVLAYLGSNEKKAHKYFSEALGNETIDIMTSSRNSGSGTTNYNRMARTLLYADELGKLSHNKCVILVQGHDPICDDKYNTYETKVFKRWNEHVCPYHHTVKIKRNRQNRIIEEQYPAIPDIEPLSRESLDYYDKAREKGENIMIYSCSMEELFAAGKTISLSTLSEYMHPADAGYARPKNVCPGTAQAQKDPLSYIQEIKSLDIYSPEQWKELIAAYRAGLDTKELQMMDDPGYSAAEMAARRDIILHIKETG